MTLVETRSIKIWERNLGKTVDCCIFNSKEQRCLIMLLFNEIFRGFPGCQDYLFIIFLNQYGVI